MDKTYADTVRLLLEVAPVAFESDAFALKGGTAINLFVREMPRLSVDLDLVFLDHRLPREEALESIARELESIAARLNGRGLRTRRILVPGAGESTLLVHGPTTQVKVEVNTVFRGTVLPPARVKLCRRAAEMFQVEMELPLLQTDELYGSKLVAAMDRQHPRDLFDLQQLDAEDGLSDGMIEAFVVYVAGHNRPIHEVILSNDKDVETAFASTFAGMTAEPVVLDSLLSVRQRVRRRLRERLEHRHREFLVGLAGAEPEWSLLRCPHAAELPALRWKLENLRRFRKQRPTEFARHVEELRRGLA